MTIKHNSKYTLYLWSDNIDVIVERDVEVVTLQQHGALVPVRLDQQVQATHLKYGKKAN